MSRICSLTGKGPKAGNMVSHSNRKTKRRFVPNLQNVSLISDVLGASFNMPIATNTLRSIDINEGFDQYLLTTSNNKLTEEAQSIKRRIQKKLKAV